MVAAVIGSLCKEQVTTVIKLLGSTFELPCLLEHQERAACAMPHLGEDFPFLVVAKNVRLRKDEKRLLSMYRLRRIEELNLRSLFLVN